MNCCDLTPVITHNEASLKFTNELKFFTFLYLGFCIFKILLFQGGDFLTELIILILLLDHYLIIAVIITKLILPPFIL